MPALPRPPVRGRLLADGRPPPSLSSHNSGAGPLHGGAPRKRARLCGSARGPGPPYRPALLRAPGQARGRPSLPSRPHAAAPPRCYPRLSPRAGPLPLYPRICPPAGAPPSYPRLPPCPALPCAAAPPAGAPAPSTLAPPCCGHRGGGLLCRPASPARPARCACLRRGRVLAALRCAPVALSWGSACSAPAWVISGLLWLRLAGGCFRRCRPAAGCSAPPALRFSSLTFHK